MNFSILLYILAGAGALCLLVLLGLTRIKFFNRAFWNFFSYYRKPINEIPRAGAQKILKDFLLWRALKLIISLVVIVIIIGGFFAWQKFLNNETDNWKSYHNELYGIEFKYPASWALKETPDSFIQINVSNGVRGPEDESVSPCQPGIASLVLQIGKPRGRQQNFEEFVNFEIENPERGRPPAVKPELIQTTVGGHNAIKISDVLNSCEKDFYYVEQSSNSYATILFIADKGEDRLIVDKIISSIRFLDRLPVPTASTTCKDEPEGVPIITSLSSYSGSVGSKFEITGCNFSGFEGDKNAWIENSQGVKGFLHGEVGSTSNLLKITLNFRLCQKDTSYSGLPCDAWLTLTPGIYKIYTAPWGKKSNEVAFTVTSRWSDQTDGIISILNEKFPGCFAQLNIPPEVRIFEEADITGDKIPEALIWNGCMGAYTTHMVLFQFIDGEPVLASFVDENGNKLEPEIFLTGSSVMNINKFGLASDLQGIYGAMGQVSVDTCTIDWKIRAFKWDSSSKAFRLDEQLSREVKQNFSQYFPPYFDPKQGPAYTPAKSCWE